MCEITIASSDTACLGTSLGSHGETTFLWFTEGSTTELRGETLLSVEDTLREVEAACLHARPKAPLHKSIHFTKKGILLSTPYTLNVLDKWAFAAHFWLWLQWIHHSLWQHYPGRMACNERVLMSFKGGVHLSQALMWNSNWELKTSLCG